MNMNQEQQMKKLWEELNKRGIFTEEQLREAVKKQGTLNISCFVINPDAEIVPVVKESSNKVS